MEKVIKRKLFNVNSEKNNIIRDNEVVGQNLILILDKIEMLHLIVEDLVNISKECTKFSFNMKVMNIQESVFELERFIQDNI